MENFDKAAKSQGSFPSTELTDRLLQRVQEPIGKIDTRPAEQIHARTAEWVSGRLDLLERYVTRYGIVEAIPQVATTTLLRFAPGWPVESVGHVLSAELPTVSPENWAATAPAASKTLLSERDERRPEGPGTDRGEFAVRRAEGAVSARTTGDSVAVPKAEASVATRGIAGSVSGDPSQPSPQVKEIPGQASSLPVRMHLRRNRADATPSKAESAARDSMGPVAASSVPEPAPVAPDVPRVKAESVPRDSMGPLAASSVALAPEIPRVKAESVSPATSASTLPAPEGKRLPLAASSVREPVALAHDMPRVKAESVSPATSASTPLAPEGERLPHVKEQKPSATPPILQRKHAAMPNPPPLAAPEAVSSAVTGDVSSKVVPGAVTAEMPMPPVMQRAAEAPRAAQSTTAPPLVARETYVAGTSAQPVSLIFRNTDGRGPATRGDSTQAPLLLAGSTRAPAPPVLRETSTTQSSGSSELSVLGGPAPEGGGGIDVAEVAEQVTRMLARQLAVDRERRGRVR